MTIGSLKIPLSGWSLLVCQRQEILNIHLPRVPTTPKYEGTMDMRSEMPAIESVGAQDMGKSGFQVSDLDDVEFYLETDQLDVDAVFRPGIGTVFSPSTFNDLRWV